MTAPSPAIPSFTDGSVLAASALNALAKNLTNLYTYTQGGFRNTKPLCVVYQQQKVGVPANGVDSLMQWDSAYANTDNMFAPSVTQLVVQTTGWYRISLQVHFDTAANGVRGCKIMVNGTTVTSSSIASDARNPVTSAEGTSLFCSRLSYLTKGATIYANYYQNSGGASNTILNFSGSFMSAEWIST